ncbi:MAG: DNA repair exonuclease [Nitrospirota bacterium]|nr:DNA repair exonuclease [Nitrospirota bacterium]
MPKLLHTADIHLGAPFKNLGEKGKEVRRALRETFSALLRLAADERVDLVLIAGDLFDANRVPADLVDFAVAEIAAARVPVCILPGTHDCLDTSSVYHGAKFGGIENLFIFTEGVTHKVYADLGLTIHGRANSANKSLQSPLAGISPNADTRWNVAMAHGSIRIESKSAPDDYPVSLEEIAASGMDYVALGHWHVAQDFSRGKTKAWYCGTPENLTFDERSPAGQALLVTIDDTGVSVESRETGRYSWREVSMDAAEVNDEPALLGKLKPLAGSRTLLKLRLTGLAHLDFIPNEDRLRELLAEQFFHVAVDTRAVHLMETELNLSAYPESTVAGRFLRIMQEKAHAAPEGERREYEEALQVGLALLKGKNIL